MMAEPAPLAPDRASMLAALEHAFGGYLDGLHDGLVEIASCERQGASDQRWYGALFGTDELEEAAGHAAAENAAGRNVYFAPALRKPGTRRDGRSHKSDVLGTTMLWVEWDAEADWVAARPKMAFCKPTMGCVTGRVPAKRAQAMWRLESALWEQAEIDAALLGLASALNGDAKVAHADCLMRLPGSISWRKLNKPERVDEPTLLALDFGDGRPGSYPTEQVLNAYKPVPGARNTALQAPLPAYQFTRGPLGLDGDRITDGRESLMFRTVLAVMVEFIGQNGTAPTPQELFDTAWPQYAARVDFGRPGRGADEMQAKCASTLRRFHAGQISSVRDLETAVRSYRARNDRQRAVEAAQALPAVVAVQPPPEGGVRLLGLDSVLAMPPPSWLVKNWLVRNGLIMVYGAPASLKSFLVLDWLLHVAYGRDWHGDRTEGGAALYVAGEGLGGLPKRLQAWLQHNGLGPDGPFFTIGQTVNMLDVREVEAVAAAVKAKATAIGKQFAVVALDTVARTMVGGEENSALDMGKYIHNGDWLKREIGCALVLVHHAGKDAARGARGSSALLGAVDTSILVERDKESGVVTLTMEKQKDAEEPPELRLTPRKIELTGHVEPVSSLVLVPEELPQTAARSDDMTPDKARQILNVIQSAWDAGDPFSEAMNSPRYVVSMMMRQFRMTKMAAGNLLGHWRDNAMLVSERRSREAPAKGLRVAKWPGDRL